MSLRFCNLQALTQFTTLPILGYKCCGCKCYKPSYQISNNSEGVWAIIYIIHGPFYSWNRECYAAHLSHIRNSSSEVYWRCLQGWAYAVCFILILCSHVSQLQRRAIFWIISTHRRQLPSTIVSFITCILAVYFFFYKQIKTSASFLRCKVASKNSCTTSAFAIS